MTVSWKARQMVPGQDTISVMAMHYGLKPSAVRDIIKTAGVQLIREDGFKGILTMVDSKGYTAGKGVYTTKVLGWSDGKAGVDSATTKLTRKAIMAVAKWKHEHSDDDVAA